MVLGKFQLTFIETMKQFPCSVYVRYKILRSQIYRQISPLIKFM